MSLILCGYCRFTRQLSYSFWNTDKYSQSLLPFGKPGLTECLRCYIMTITREETAMLIEIDFQSDEAIYMQLRNPDHTWNRDIASAGGRYPSVGKTAGRRCRHQYAYRK